MTVSGFNPFNRALQFLSFSYYFPSNYGFKVAFLSVSFSSSLSESVSELLELEDDSFLFSLLSAKILTSLITYLFVKKFQYLIALSFFSIKAVSINGLLRKRFGKS